MVIKSSPLTIIQAALRTGLDPAEYGQRVYIGRAPDDAPRFVSVSRGQSQGLLYGYGSVAYRYTAVNILCREGTYERLEDLVLDVVYILLSLSGFVVTAFSPATPQAGGEDEIIELTITGDYLEKI